MAQFYTIEWNEAYNYVDEDNLRIAIVDGKPEVIVNRAGLEQLIERAPNRRRADAFRKLVDSQYPWTGTRQRLDHN